MEELKIVCSIVSYESEKDLSEPDRELLAEAENATKNAYAPYSKFRVGAALRLKSGRIIKGNNQENVAYPSGLCAERVAFFYASATYPGEEIESVAITAVAEKFNISTPVTPCGSCRQVMAETEKNQQKNIRIIMNGDNGKIFVAESAMSLLPFMFRADELKK